MKTLLSLFTASALALCAAEGTPAVRLTVTPERDVLPTTRRETLLQVELRAMDASSRRRTLPINLAVALDRSGSMTGAKLEKARQAAEVALDQLGPDDRFSLVVYDDEVQVLIPPQRVKERKTLKEKIHAIRAGGGTALYAGVEKAAAQLRKYFDSENINRIILLSDGNANVGPSRPADLARLGRELREEGQSVSTVGLGDDYNEDLMTALAEASHANYYYVQDVEKLPDIFAGELRTVKSVVARNVRVTITLPEGVRARGVLGEEEISFHGQSVTIPLSDFYGAQTRRFLIACEVPEGENETLDLASVELSYDDAESGRSATERRSLRVRRSADPQAVEDSIRAEVAVNAALTRNRLAKEQAVRLADAGKSREAADLLLRQAARNAALPEVAQSSLLKTENGVLRQKAEELQRRGSLSKASRKEVQYQNYQDKKQKR
jgi:Ca-activated chloride channel family protein